MRSDEIPLCETVGPQTSTIVGANRQRRGAGNRGSVVVDARQSEPSESLAEKFDGECAIGRENHLSPVRVPQTPIAKNPRNRAFFSVEPWMRRGRLCNVRLNRGGRSSGATHLSSRYPAIQTEPDSQQVDGVGGERVSAIISLIYRESTGNFSEIGLL